VVIEAPACHGSALAVSGQSPTCRSCPHARSCVRVAAAFLMGLPHSPLVQRERLALALTARSLLGVPAAPAPTPDTGTGQGEVARGPTPGRAPLSPKEETLVAHLPRRVASQVRSLLETGWFDFARAELHAGRNPASKGWKHVYCAQLLGGQATRESLRQAFVERLGLKPASATVQLCHALAIFAAGEIAVESLGRLRLLSKPVDRP
jgi:hypothetical protein